VSAPHDASDEEVPTTLVGAPVGGGETTLVDRLLEAPGDRRIAVLVDAFDGVTPV
jgi:G3E family GTPase